MNQAFNPTTLIDQKRHRMLLESSNVLLSCIPANALNLVILLHFLADVIACDTF